MWEVIRSNHIKSAVMVSLMGALLAAVGAFLGYYFFDDALIGVILALVIWAIMWLVTYFQGDSILLSMSGARKIEKQDSPRLFNIVEEMTIASGLPKMPDVYLIDDPALNAFATGRDINHASVAITSGLMEKLNRDELTGVIGHEIAHIKDRDVYLMVILSVMVGTIVILSWYASRMMLFGGMGGGGNRRKRGGGDSGGAIQLILVVVGLVLMILAPIFAQLIYFAVSRRREYLSDASSALYTRYPEGLASALDKLATNNTHVATANKATASMYIADPFQKAALKAEELTSTHPPLADRIRILRRMSGASYADYEKAYEEFHKGQHAVPQSAVSGGGTGGTGAVPGSVGLRAPSADNAPVSKADRARETSNLLYKLNDYKVIDCDCGVRLKVPADYTADQVKCPRCGETHPMSEAK